ncbi:YUH1 [Candida theae]|uniref:Ubiquitin carboxyl-terminal hydrolase n=1 Tax=Candida theae TaxID=1198502 RepID=A0AAD5BHA8_9ASCO|nr:YUH1 [Candida theae]KAI5963368.1 YUH1 [Candida theae]
MADSKSVIPLESNPSIFTELSHKLGLSPILQFHDVYSLTDPELLSFLPQPIFGIILLFPLTPNYEAYRKEKDSQSATYNNENGNVHWFKQTIGNGCGLYALLHLLTNISPDLTLSHSQINDLVSKIQGRNLSVVEASLIVEQLEKSIKLDEQFGSKGQTEAPPPEEAVDLHFISFIKGRDNHLYELDGRRNGPIDLGEISSTGNESIIKDQKLIDKIQFYIDNADEKNKHNFALMALGPTLD